MNEKSPFRPLGKQIVGRQNSPVKETADGILLTEQTAKQIAEEKGYMLVLAVGPEVDDIVPGDLVVGLLSPHASLGVEVDGVVYVVMSCEMVLAVVEHEKALVG